MFLSLTKQTQEKILVAVIFTANILVGSLVLWLTWDDVKNLPLDPIPTIMFLCGVMLVTRGIGMLYRKDWARGLTIILYVILGIIFTKMFSF